MGEKERPAEGTIIIENTAGEWCLALFLQMACFILMLEYHRWRGRNYVESLPSFLFTANKAMAISSVLSISFSLAAGSLGRLARLPQGSVRLRRPMGVIGALGIVPHVLLSFFFLGKNFDGPYYVRNWIPSALGAAALLGFLWLAAISWPWALARLGPARWKAWQRTGFALIVVVFLHSVVLLGKLANWPDWFGKIGSPSNPPVPPGSLVIAACVLSVLALKSADRIAGARRVKP